MDTSTYSGIKRPEELFRSIARQRRACITQVSGDFGHYAVTFLHGKVVGVAGNGEIELVQGLLQAGGRLASSLAHVAEFSALEDLLSKQGLDGRTLVAEARRVVAMSRLYEVLIDPSGEASIASDLVEAQSDVMAPVSVGQLMLDVAALMSEGGRFGAILESPVPYEISPQASASVGSEREEEALHLLSEGRTLAQLEAAMLVTRYEFQDLVLGLVDRGLLVAPRGGAEKPYQDSVVSALEQSIDAAVAEELAQQEFEAPAEVVAPSLGVPGTLTAASAWVLQASWVPNFLVILLLLGLALAIVYRWVPLLVGQ